MEKGARTRLTTALVLAAVFSAGLLVGMAADRPTAATEEQATDSAASGERERRTPMWEQVGPTEAQTELIDSIVRGYRGDHRALQRELRDAYYQRYQELIERTRTDIKSVLTPEQAVAYDSLVAEYERRRAERGSRENRD